MSFGLSRGYLQSNHDNFANRTAGSVYLEFRREMRIRDTDSWSHAKYEMLLREGLE